MSAPQIVRAGSFTRETEESSKHPWNPNSEIHGHSLSDRVGMQRIGLWRVRLPPGKESFVLHSHQTEEEFLYVLSGRGMVQIGDQHHEIGPGDFVGFSAPSVAHHLKNPFAEDLVYLSGGERHEIEIAEYPAHGKRLVRIGREALVYPLQAGKFTDRP